MIPQAKAFDFDAIIGAYSGVMMYGDSPPKVRELLSFMTGRTVLETTTVQDGEECRPHLLVQYPLLDKLDTGSLKTALEAASTQEARAEEIRGWLNVIKESGLSRTWRTTGICVVPTSLLRSVSGLGAVIVTANSQFAVTA